MCYNNAVNGNGQCVQKDDMGKVYHALGEADMYDGAMFSYQGDFLDYLGLEGMGVVTAQTGVQGMATEKLEETRRFGASL